jgi:flavin-dependent dehydrogenase
MPNSSLQFDLAIVGGGPAGTSCAITGARLRASVGLFEAKEFPRHRVCGEFVSAESPHVLAGLLQDGPAAAKVFQAAPVIDRTRLLLGQRMIEAPVAPPALSISRYDLDAALWEAACRAGAVAHPNCEVTGIDGDGPFTLRTSSGTFTAKAMIVAAGRWSQFTADRTVAAGPKWIGLKAHFRESWTETCTDLYFFPNGYCGVQPVTAGVVNACAMVRSDRATSLEEVFRLHPKLALRASHWSATMQPVITAPLIYRQPQPVRRNTILAGDAAAFIDPFAGDGISIALRSGSVAAQCICKFLMGPVGLSDAVRIYQQEYSQQFAPLLSAAARVRHLLTLPPFAQSAVFELLRLPGLVPYMIRKTRRAAIE